MLEKLTNESMRAKIGIFGFQGSGKTFTAGLIATGLHKFIKSKKPVGFIDSEKGVGYIKSMFDKEKIPVLRDYTKSFKTLLEDLAELENQADIVVIDSLSTFWNDLKTSYETKVNRSLQFQDWGKLKGPDMWGKYVDIFLNSNMHIIACGRAGFEYDNIQNQSGGTDLVKTGTKMKAEGEFGFEPSLVIEMEQANPYQDELKTMSQTQRRKAGDPKKSMIVNRAYILKDRFNELMGTTIDQPNFESFLPHISRLKLSGDIQKIERGDTSSMIEKNTGRSDWIKNKEAAKIQYEEIVHTLQLYWPGATAVEKLMRNEIMFQLFETRSPTAIEKMDLDFMALNNNRIRDLDKCILKLGIPPAEKAADVPAYVTALVKALIR